MPDSSTETSRTRGARWAREARSQLSPLRLSPTREAEVVDELVQHLEDHWDELVRGGASADEASRIALDRFRGGNMLAEQMASLRQAHARAAPAPGAVTGRTITDIWQDLRYAARVFTKQPGFTAAAVLTLALGIGASTATFSVVYGVLLKPLSFDQPEQLVTLFHRAPIAGRNQSVRSYFTYRDNQRAFDDVGAWDGGQVSITGRGEPEQVQSLTVTEATLRLLRVRPRAGRFFTGADDAPGAPLTVVLTHGYWQRRFGGAADTVGQPLQIDGRPAEVIGVLPASFRFPLSDADVLIPMQLDRVNASNGFGIQALARLRPGLTLAQANADMDRMIQMLPADGYARLRLQADVRPLAEYATGGVGRVLWILLAAVGVLLLIACGNVANLFLVRAEGRQQEFSMRAALGASRGRIARVLLSETLLLAGAAGLVGIAVSRAGLGMLKRIAPADLPRAQEIGIDPAVLLFTVAVSVMAGVSCALLAVTRFGTLNFAAIRDRSASDTPGRHRTRNSLVVTQVALALVLMVVSGLMIRTVVAMRQVPPGFIGAEAIQTFTVAVPTRAAAEPIDVARRHHSIADRLAQVPGVVSVGLSSSITMDGENNGNSLEVEDVRRANGELPPLRRFKSVAPGYFETMGNPVVAGRSITWTDIYEQRAVAVISSTLAREYWRDPAKAVGRRVRSNSDGPWHEVVGVVGDERDDGLNRPATAIVYWPLLNGSYRRPIGRPMAYAVRSTRVGTAGFLSDLHRAVWAVDPTLPLGAVQTVAEIQSRSMAQTSFVMVTLAIAAGGAVLLGMVGIYGVISYVAAQRTREVGIRMAIGAQVGDVRRIFLRHGLRLAAAGTAAGIVVALILTRVMSALLFGVSPVDPMTYAVVSGILGSVAVLSSYIPARRASRVDPVEALRTG